MANDRIGLEAGDCGAATTDRSGNFEAGIRHRGVGAARLRSANARCGTAGWGPHHVQNPASGNQGLDPSGYGTHSMRRTKAALIYRKTGNLRAVQLLLGHTKVDSTVRYLGVELDDTLSIAEKIDI
jgi:integrase